jgi:hypothetical protein
VKENNKDENEEDMVPSFAETYEALEKVRAFFYAHSVTDADRERIFGLEVIFSIEAKFCHEAKDNVRLFSLKKRAFGFFVFADFRLFSPLPSKTKNGECTVI